MSKLDGRRVLITGGAQGIGLEMAMKFAGRGADVVIADLNEGKLPEAKAKIEALGVSAWGFPVDVTNPASIAALKAQIAAEVGPIDVLVNNAGYGHHRRFLDWDLEDMERVMRVNFLGSLYFTKALLPAMVERGRGWLVFVASAAGRVAPADETIYAASKHAMVGLAGSLSLEVEDAGVHVLTVCPGAIRTPFFDDEALARLPAVARRQMAEPEDLVEAIMEALARGRRELTFPRWIASGYVVQALAPSFFRRQLKKHTVRDD